MFGLIHALTYCFCTVDFLLLLYFMLIRCTLDYSLPTWNIMTSDANKLKCVKWQFAAVSLSHFPLIFLTIMLLQLHTAQVTGHHFDALFLLFMFFQDLNFILPWLLILVWKFLLVILYIPPRFLQDIKFAGCFKFGMQWYRYRYTE